MFKLDPSYVLNDFFKNSGVQFEKPNKLMNNKLLRLNTSLSYMN